MGRRAGVTAEETREQLLEAAARVFARRGYEGASISEISSEAGLTSGAIYAHYPSKAELFVATLRAYKWREIRQLLGSGGDFLEELASIGSTLDQGRRFEGSLLMEAVVTAQRDPEVARLLAGTIAEREGLIADAVRRAQAAGKVDGTISPEAVARFAMMLALGSLVTAAADVPRVDHRAWAELIASVIDLTRAGRPKR